MSIKYSKAVIDNKLQIKSYWSKKDKNKHVHQIFKKWNAKLRILKDPSRIQQAEYYLELCSQAMSLYKIKAKLRKPKKISNPEPVKTISKKKVIRKKNNNEIPSKSPIKSGKKEKISNKIKPEKSYIQKIEEKYGISVSSGQAFAYTISVFFVLSIIIPIPISNTYTD